MRLPYQKLVWAFILLHLTTNGLARALPVSSLEVRSSLDTAVPKVVINDLDRRAGGGGGGRGEEHPTGTGGGHGTGGKGEDGPGGTGAATGGDDTVGGYHDDSAETTGGVGDTTITGPKKEPTQNTNDHTNTQSQNPACVVKRSLSARGECFAPDGTPAKTKFGPEDQKALDDGEKIVLENGKTPRSNEELDAAYARANEKWSKPYDASVDPRVSQEGGLQKVYDTYYKADRDLREAKPNEGDSKYIADAGLLKLGKDSSGKDVSINPDNFVWGRYAVRSKANGKDGSLQKGIFVDANDAALVTKIGYDKTNNRVVIIAEQKAQKFDTNRYQTDNKGNQIFKNGKPQPITDGGKTEAAQYLPNSELAIRSAIKELKVQGVADKDIKAALSELIIVQQQVINMETQAIVLRIYKEMGVSRDNRIFLSATEPEDAVWINRLEMSDNVKPGDNMRWSHPEYFAGDNPQILKDFWLTADTKSPSGGVYETIFYKFGYQY